MKVVFYNLLMIATAFMLGVASYSLYLSSRLYILTGERRWIWHGLVKIGFVFTSVVLLEILLPTEAHMAMPPNGRAWFYLVGVAISGIGVLGVGRSFASELLNAEENQGRFARHEEEVPPDEPGTGPKEVE